MGAANLIPDNGQVERMPSTKDATVKRYHYESHEHLLGDDGKKRVNPGCSFIGRLKGLAEIARREAFGARYTW